MSAFEQLNTGLAIAQTPSLLGAYYTINNNFHTNSFRTVHGMFKVKVTLNANGVS